MTWWSMLPWQKKLAVAGIILVLLGLIALATLNSANSALRRASDDGAAIERGKAAEKSIERVEAANEVRAGIQYAPALWCDQCVRHSRTPANCRYQLPGVQDHQLCPAAAGPAGRSGERR
jgi:hypothetical protein